MKNPIKILKIIRKLRIIISECEKSKIMAENEYKKACKTDDLFAKGYFSAIMSYENKHVEDLKNLI